MTALAPLAPDYGPLLTLVVNSVRSVHTKRAYARALGQYIAWQRAAGVPFCRASVNQYRAHLETQGASTSSINQALSAIKKLSTEASAGGYISEQTDYGVQRIEGAQRHGVRSGNWLTVEQARHLLELPPDTRKGKRDRALLSLLLGCGLRRSEACALDWQHVQMRDGRPCIVDLVGKHGRVRTVPMPAFCWRALEQWREVAGQTAGPILREISKADQPVNGGLSPAGAWFTVKRYARALGVTLAPHDLRRTAARLAKRGGADLIQLQMSLGHSSPTVTSTYLGHDQDLEHGPFDLMGLG
jgi:integrase